MHFDILKPINECPHTSLETLITNMEMRDNKTLQHFKDDCGRHRMIIKQGELVIACQLFDASKTCTFIETLPEFQNQGIQRELWAYSCIMLGHIEPDVNQTKDGERFFKKYQ